MMNQGHEPEIVNQMEGVMDMEDDGEYQEEDEEEIDDPNAQQVAMDRQGEHLIDENDNIPPDGYQPGDMIDEDQLDEYGPVDDVEEADQQVQMMNAR